MKSFSARRRLFDNIISKKKKSSKLQNQIILVRNLSIHTVKKDIYDYFNDMLRAKVTRIRFNSWGNKYYNKSCLVTFSSPGTAKRVMKILSHKIQDVEVNVERYLGKEKHQKGEHNLYIKGMDEPYILYKLCEDMAVGCGPHSGIDFERDQGDGLHNGEVIINFYEESHRNKALNLVTKEYNWDAAPKYWYGHDDTLPESVDQGNQD